MTMTWIVIDLFGEPQTNKTDPNLKATNPKPLEVKEDRQLHKQVINTNGEVVTI